MKTLLPICIGCFIAAITQAQILHVPGDYPTIQQGIDAASNGDTVLVSDGTYYEQINFLGKKPLMVASEFLMDGDISHIANTIIDGSQATNPDSSSVICFITGEDTTSVLCGFTIQGGKGTYWELWQSYIGGGIYIDSSSATIRNNIIQDNVLNDTLSTVSLGCCGAGIGSAYGYPGWTIIENNTIKNNLIYSKFDWIEGGGIYTYVTNTRIKNNIVTGNLNKNLGYGYSAGGGMFIWSDSESALIIEAEVRDNFIENNEVWASAASAGGGVFAGLANTMFINNIVNGNKSAHLPPFMGAAVYYGGGMEFEFMTENSLISNNVFSNNKCDGLGGGIDIWLPFFADFPIQNNYFTGNEAVLGGAIVVADSASLVRFVNNVFSHNNATSQGGAIWINRGNGSPEEHLTVSINNSFYDNQADTLGGAVYVYEDNPILLNSILWQNPDMSGNEIVVESGYTELAYSDIDSNLIAGDKVVGEGTIFMDPVFDDLDLLTLSELSQCINKGVELFNCQCGTPFSCPEQDIIGISRPQNGLVDMGAYETILEGIWEHPLNNIGLKHSLNPNPFINHANLSYKLDTKTKVEINLYNSSGELIQTLLSVPQEAGNHELQFSSGNLPAGIYFYRITTDSKQATGRMILMK